jgi:hypothetical protein
MIQYIYNLGLGIDQFINVLLLGDPDESLSGRTGRAMLSGTPVFFVPFLWRFIDFVALVLAGELNHCINAVENEERPHEKELWSWIKKGK